MNMATASLVAFRLLMLLKFAASLVQQPETCENQEFVAECPAGHVVIMKTAVYGRMRFGKCIDKDYGYLGCQVNVLDIADKKCSGTRKCTVGIPDPDFGMVNKCPRDLKPYLEATYTCQKVITVAEKACVGSDFVLVTAESGYLSSLETTEKKVGSAECPWKLQVSPGQKIEITLMDFDTFDHRKGVCHAYAILRENVKSARSTTVCSEGKRSMSAYVTSTDNVEIRVISSQNPKSQRRFLLKFQATGCANPPKPAGGWMTRSGNKAQLGCRGTNRKWSLVCEGKEWTGHKHTCYNGTDPITSGEVRASGFKLPIRLSIILIVSTALLIGILVLLIGLLCLRWQRQKTDQRIRQRRMDDIYGAPPSKETGMPIQQDYLTYPRDPTIYTQKEGDGGYYTSENDYAYISDMTTPSMFESRQGVYEPCTTSQKYCGPGTGSGNVLGSGSAPLTRHAHSDRGVFRDPTPCLLPVDRQNNVRSETPKYFELDPDVAKDNSSASTSVGGRGKKSTAAPQQPIDDQNAYNAAVMTRVNKSIHDFGYCSPVSWTAGSDVTSGDENHKSV